MNDHESAPRAQHLIVARESAVYDRILMKGMIEQTLEKARDVPGTAEMKSVGIDLMDHPDRYGARSIRRGKTRAIVSVQDDVVYLYSMGSAASRDEKGDNAFVQILCDVITQYKPQEMWASSMTRLIRSPLFAGALMQAAMGTVDVVHADSDIDLRTTEGKIVWQVFAMVAGMERDLIVHRHQAGRVNAWKRNAWLPATALPPGYVLGEGRKLELDGNMVEPVRGMFAVLANPDLTAAQVCRRLGDLGISTPKIRRLHGEDATFADARHASSAVRSLVGWLPVYETGVYEAQWPNQMPGISTFGGVAVEEEPGFEHGVLRLPYPLPQPDGGWAHPDVFEAIRQRRDNDSPPSAVRGGGAQRRVRPLVGLFLPPVDGFEHQLQANGKNYAIHRRRFVPDERFPGWHGERSGDHVASVGQQTMHQSIANGIAKAIRDGVAAELLPGEIVWIGDAIELPALSTVAARQRRLTQQIEDETKRVARARKNANDCDDSDLRSEFLDDARRAATERRRLNRLVEDLETEAAVLPTLPDRFESNADILIHALSALANSDGPQSSDLRSALRSIIVNTSLKIADETVTWTAYVRLPLDEGVALLGPISGTVPNTKAHEPQGTTKHQRRNKVKEFMSAGLTKRAAESAASAPHADLARVLLAGDDEPLSNWARHVRQVYRDPAFAWNTGRWMLPNDTKARLCDVLAACDGCATVGDVEAAGISRSQWKYLTRKTEGPSGAPIATLGTGRGSQRLIESVACPHCGSHASVSVPVPEVPMGLLCPDCRRAPSDASPEFPAWYLDQTAASVAA